jgi:hypothetical protein
MASRLTFLSWSNAWYRMDEERLFPVLLLDLIFGRIDAKVEDVVWAEAGCLKGKYSDQLLAYLLITSPAYFNLNDFKTLSTCTSVSSPPCQPTRFRSIAISTQIDHLELLDKVARLLSNESLDVDFLGCFGHGGDSIGSAKDEFYRGNSVRIVTWETAIASVPLIERGRYLKCAGMNKQQSIQAIQVS